MDWLAFLIYLATTCVAAGTGVLAKPGPWYVDLVKPSWTPPNWAFPVVWTLLYVVMAVAAARVAHLGVHPVALGLWGLQITINAIWSPVFFGMKRMRAGLVIIAGLWLAVAATLVAFWQVDLLAGLLLVPYLAWVSVAAGLNGALIRLNPDQRQ